jgi:hypothetical protein
LTAVASHEASSKKDRYVRRCAFPRDDDRGGNLVAIAGPCKSSLHAIWDNRIIEKGIGRD